MPHPGVQGGRAAYQLRKLSLLWCCCGVPFLLPCIRIAVRTQADTPMCDSGITNDGRTCGSTPLLVLLVILSYNKICLF